jgi:hypothetical protein
MAPDDMPRINVDPKLAERLIEGRASSADVPAAAAAAGHVLAAARRAATESDDSGTAATVAAMRAILAPGADSAPVPVRTMRRVAAPLPRLIAAGAAGLAVLFGGLAAAGALPAGAQNPVADLASHVGIELPRPSSDTKPPETPVAETTTTSSTTPTTVVPGETPTTVARTSETTVTAPPCPPPSYDGPNGCVTPLPVPPPTTTPPPPPTTTTTQKPPPPTTTTSTTVADGGSSDGGHGRPNV